ncbi:MAG TPA: AmmeMemoRadiSam system protein B [Methyloceanibacter sp.]|nr:AmmeMemoRadiSam system protein B [Methyloceanibacter sp.]
MFARAHGLTVRQPAVAGSFYPRGGKDLKTAVDALLSQADQARQSGLVSVIAPHAGYMYSGPVAGSAFAPVASSGVFERVLLIGPAHYVPVRGVAAPSAASFATPLGTIALDRDAIATMVEAGLASIDDRAHAPEHALEVELPFLQAVLGRFTLIPLLAGDAAPEEVAAIIDALLDERTLLVVSTDLSHYLDYASARKRDLATAETVERLAFDRLGPYDACGFAALNGALRAARGRGWSVKRLDLRNSGDTSGDRARVVGYGAWVFSAARPAA